MWKDLGKMWGVQGDKQEKACHMVWRLNLDVASVQMGKKAVDGVTYYEALTPH